MNPSEFHFRGAPEYVDAAAERAGRPDLAGHARRIAPLAALATLCAQAVESEGARAVTILRQAAEFRDQLRIASEAADAMLSAVAGACGAGRAIDDGTPPGGPKRRRRPASRGKQPGETP